MLVAPGAGPRLRPTQRHETNLCNGAIPAKPPPLSESDPPPICQMMKGFLNFHVGRTDMGWGITGKFHGNRSRESHALRRRARP